MDSWLCDLNRRKGKEKSVQTFSIFFVWTLWDAQKNDTDTLGTLKKQVEGVKRTSRL